MANFAVITGSTVSNIIVADTVEIAEEVTGCICIEYTDAKPAGIGWTYDQHADVFVPPVEVIDEASTI
jgi:hypothetical protein